MRDYGFYMMTMTKRTWETNPSTMLQTGNPPSEDSRHWWIQSRMNISCRLRIILRETSMKGRKSWSGLRVTPSYIEPGQAAYQEGGDDGDEHQSESLLATSATSSLSHLIISLPNRHLRQDDVVQVMFFHQHILGLIWPPGKSWGWDSRLPRKGEFRWPPFSASCGSTWCTSGDQVWIRKSREDVNENWIVSILIKICHWYDMAHASKRKRTGLIKSMTSSILSSVMST